VSLISRLVSYIRVQASLVKNLSLFDVVYVRAHFAAAPVVWWAQARGIHVVHEINGQPRDLGISYPALKFFVPIFAWLHRVQYRRATYLFAVTEGLKEWVRGFAGHDRVAVISNGANTDIFHPDGPAADFGGRVVVFVGGLVAWHGINTMLAALREDDWPPDIALVIIGDGRERAKLERCPESRLKWLELKPYADIPTFLRGALAALCIIEDPGGRSASGAAPLKMFEAMACGIPVIVSDLPFQTDIVRAADAGLVVPPGSPAALAQAVATLTRDNVEARRMGRNGAAYVLREASWRSRSRELHLRLLALANGKT
jgi:glycosyltransferase involved in cell wall biosynthesis